MANSEVAAEPEGGDPVGGTPPLPPAGDTEGSHATAPAEDGALLRAMADLDNLRKRFHREVARERDAERSRVAAAWLPVVDDLDRALEAVGSDVSTSAGFTDGVRAVRDHALSVLERLGFPRFEDRGEPFDPRRHEAVGAVQSDARAGTVVAVVRAGYGSDDVILRPAGVVVARP